MREIKLCYVMLCYACFFNNFTDETLHLSPIKLQKVLNIDSLLTLNSINVEKNIQRL